MLLLTITITRDKGGAAGQKARRVNLHAIIDNVLRTEQRASGTCATAELAATMRERSRTPWRACVVSSLRSARALTTTTAAFRQIRSAEPFVFRVTPKRKGNAIDFARFSTIPRCVIKDELNGLSASPRDSAKFVLTVSRTPIIYLLEIINKKNRAILSCTVCFFFLTFFITINNVILRI